MARVIKWIEAVEAEGRKESIGGLGGWFNFRDKGKRWADYLDIWTAPYQPYAEAIRKAVIEDNLTFGGDTHQQSMTPLFSDGTVGSFSYRGWADLMAAIWSEEHNTDYNYMEFYMTNYNQESILEKLQELTKQENKK